MRNFHDFAPSRLFYQNLGIRGVIGVWLQCLTRNSVTVCYRVLQQNKIRIFGDVSLSNVYMCVQTGLRKYNQRGMVLVNTVARAASILTWQIVCRSNDIILKLR